MINAVVELSLKSEISTTNRTIMNDLSSADQDPSFFGLSLATHRVLLNNTSLSSHEPISSSFFYEAIIAAIAIAFFRSTVRLHHHEPPVFRWFFCGLLAVLACTKKSYELITAVEIFSYVVSWLLLRPLKQEPHASSISSRDVAFRLLSIAAGAALSMLFSHAVFTSGLVWRAAHFLTPSILIRFAKYLFPVNEMMAAYDIMGKLALEPDIYQQMMQHLLFVTFHIQVGMGYLGIDFLRADQSRRNQLIRLDVQESEVGSKTQNGSSADNIKNGDNKKVLERARIFQRGAAPFSK